MPKSQNFVGLDAFICYIKNLKWYRLIWATLYATCIP